MILIDFRHGISTSIESQLESKIRKLKASEVKLFVILGLLFVTINFFWLSRMTLSSNLPYAFALFFLLGSASMGITLGRGLVAFTSVFQFDNSLTKPLAKETVKEQKENALFMISCLSSNVQHKLSTLEQNRIKIQRQRFHEFCSEFDSDAFESWIAPIAKAADTFENFETSFLKSFSPKTDQWVKVVRLNCLDDRERNIVNATILLDATSFLLHKVTPLTSVSDELFKQILRLTGIYLNAAQGQLEGLLEGTSEVIRTTKVQPEKYPFLRAVARKEINLDQHNWDPIQLVALLYRTTQTFQLVEELNVNSQLDSEAINSFDPVITDHLFGSILHFLREHDHNLELQNQPGFRSNYFSNIQNWPILRENGMKKNQFSTIYEKLLLSIPRSKFSLVQQLILLAWNLNQARIIPDIPDEAVIAELKESKVEQDKKLKSEAEAVDKGKSEVPEKAKEESNLEAVREEVPGEDDKIEIGSHVGLSFDDEEVFGVIIEFDDEEDTVTIKEDGTGDLVTGYQEDMFVK